MDTFLWPLSFFLISLPILMRVVFSGPKQMDAPVPVAVRVPFFNRLMGYGSAVHCAHTIWLPLLMWLSWICFVFACMRPVMYMQATPITHEARNIMLAIDTSGSMAQKDYDLNGLPLSRLSMVKVVVNDFINNRSDDNIGLVIFGSEAYTYAPLSFDKKTLKSLFGEVEIGIAGEQTAIGDAIALAVQNVSQSPKDSRIIILLSDGYANAGEISVDNAVGLAKRLGAKVYTIGVGSNKKWVDALVGMLVSNTGADLDEKTLKSIAEQTGGKYFRATSTSELQEIYQTIDALEQTRADELIAKPRRELFWLPLLGALIFLCAVLFLKRRAL